LSRGGRRRVPAKSGLRAAIRSAGSKRRRRTAPSGSADWRRADPSRRPSCLTSPASPATTSSRLDRARWTTSMSGCVETPHADGTGGRWARPPQRISTRHSIGAPLRARCCPRIRARSRRYWATTRPLNTSKPHPRKLAAHRPRLFRLVRKNEN